MRKIVVEEMIESPVDMDLWENIKRVIGVQMDNDVILPIDNKIASEAIKTIKEDDVILLDWSDIQWDGDVNHPMIIK